MAHLFSSNSLTNHSIVLIKLFIVIFLSAQGHDSQKVLNIANQKLKNEFHIFHSTIQVEMYQESVMSNCIDCQDLKD